MTNLSPCWTWNQNGQQQRVIIVGAGAAGLECARCLLQRGWPEQSLLLLESESRVGGRIMTVEPHGLSCDHGAAWVHGASAENPMMALAADHAIELYHTCQGNPWMEPEHMLRAGLSLKPDVPRKELERT